MPRVDQLFMYRRRVGENPQPAERINPLEHFQAVRRNRLPRHAMETVATGDVVTIESIRFAVLVEGDKGFSGFHAVGYDVAGFIDRLCTGVPTSGHQIAGDLGLAIDRYGFAARQRLQIDVYPAPIEGQFEACMHQPFGVHALTHSSLTQQLYHALFEDTGADASEHIVRGLAFEDQGVDAGVMQQLAE